MAGWLPGRATGGQLRACSLQHERDASDRASAPCQRDEAGNASAAPSISAAAACSGAAAAGSGAAAVGCSNLPRVLQRSWQCGGEDPDETSCSLRGALGMRSIRLCCARS